MENTALFHHLTYRGIKCKTYKSLPHKIITIVSRKAVGMSQQKGSRNESHLSHTQQYLGS